MTPVTLSGCPFINDAHGSPVPARGVDAHRFCWGMRCSIQRTPSDNTIVIDR